MKGLGGLIMMGVALVAVYFLWTRFGGEFSGSAPQVDQPDIGIPDVNEAGDKATDAANDAADEVGAWSLQTWKLIILGIVAIALTKLWFSNPRFRYIVIGIFIAIVIMIGFIPQFQ